MRNRKRNAVVVGLLAAVFLLSWAVDAQAQRRRGSRPRIGRSNVRVSVGVGVGVGVRYWPFYYGGYYGPYRYYGPYGPYGPHYGAYGYEPTGAIRVEVKPEETEVFVDGYFAGQADNFDGFFQRLRLPPGEYEIELRLDGYRSVRERILLSPGSTYKIRHFMETLRPGEPMAPRPEPSEPPAYPTDSQAYPPEYPTGPQPYPPERPAYPPERPDYPPDEPGGRATPGAPPTSSFGTLALRVRPLDAEILIDGEPWQRPTGADRLVVELGPGRHRLEIRKAGYHRYVTKIEVLAGEATIINVGLPPVDDEGI